MRHTKEAFAIVMIPTTIGCWLVLHILFWHMWLGPGGAIAAGLGTSIATAIVALGVWEDWLDWRATKPPKEEV